MRRLKQFVIATLVNDPTINSFVDRRVVPMEYDFIPETLPAITVSDVGGKHRSVPSRARDVLVQADIWSNVSALETDNIYEQMTTLLNTPVNGTAKLPITSASEQIYWVREDNVRDLPDPTRTLFHKAVTFRAWARS